MLTKGKQYSFVNFLLYHLYRKELSMRKALLILLAAYIVLFCACAKEPAKQAAYTVSQNEDQTYSYKVFDQKGDVLFADDHCAKEPHINKVTDRVYSVTVQAGTGLATNWAVFCDVESSKVSEVFHYVLIAQGDYVIYASCENGQQSIIVQNMFDKAAYCQAYPLSNCSAVAADFVIGVELKGEGIAVVTYLTGDNYTETTLTIQFP